jgi:putative ABC transport system ATP-binding protein
MIDNSYVFELNNICFAYPGSENVLENINLKVNQNDIIIIKGDSGIGKSTFLKLFNRFSDCTEGELFFRGRKLSTYNIEKIRSSIMYLPQLPHIIDGTVEENLRFPYKFHTHSKKRFDENRAKELFNHFHLNFSVDCDALRLSIGQRQRISLIRAILLGPEVLLLDEPGSSLDESNRKNLEKQVELLTDSSRITVIMATHGEVSFQNKKHRMFNISNRNLTEHL